MTVKSYITGGTVVVRLHVGFTSITRIHKAISALRVQLIEHCHGGELGASQRRELVMFLTRRHQECVSSVHQVVCH